MSISIILGQLTEPSTIHYPTDKAPHANEVIRLKSFAGEGWHTISLARRTCDCSEFKRTCVNCKHLNALGVYPLKAFTARTHPTFSQALSALVKSLRIRRVDDAVYWLLYLHTFKEPQHRFRTARRLLISSAEDGHSIAVMEQVQEPPLPAAKSTATGSLKDRIPGSPESGPKCRGPSYSCAEPAMETSAVAGQGSGCM